MPTFISYKCNTCLRTKDIPKDNIRALPNLCIITQGCDGRIFPIAETPFATSYDQVNGLTDWTIKKDLDNSTAKTITSFFEISTSKSGSISLAIPSILAVSEVLKVTLTQQTAKSVKYQQYTFKFAVPTISISGKDLNGKNLIFSSDDISSNRIKVLVNGIEKYENIDFVFSPNTITFLAILPANTNIVVNVYVENVIDTSYLYFYRNGNNRLSPSSWSNIKSCMLPGEGEYSLYTCDIFSNVSTTTRLKVESVHDEYNEVVPKNNLDRCFFVLSKYPYGNVDRYKNFILELSTLSLDFNLLINANNKFSVDSAIVKEIFPELQLRGSKDFIIPDYYDSLESDKDEVSSQVFLIPSKNITNK